MSGTTARARGAAPPAGIGVPRGGARERAREILGVPELNLLFFGFLLFLPWELWLSAASLRSDGHALASEVAWMSTLASLGHAAISVLAFWVVVGGNPAARGWIRVPRLSTVLVFVLSALVFTVIGESVATGVLTEWEHVGSFPTLVAPRLGLASLLEVVTVPLATIWIVGRHLSGSVAAGPVSPIQTEKGGQGPPGAAP